MVEPKVFESNELSIAQQCPTTETPSREALNETDAGTAIATTENQDPSPSPTPPHDIGPVALPSASPSANNSRCLMVKDVFRGHKWSLLGYNETQTEGALKDDIKRYLNNSPMLRGCGPKLQRLFAIGWRISGEVRVRSYEFHVSLNLNKRSFRDANDLLQNSLDLNTHREKLDVSKNSFGH